MLNEVIRVRHIKHINIFIFISSFLCLIFDLKELGIILIFSLLSMWSLLPFLVSTYLAPLEFLTIFQYIVVILFGPLYGGIFGMFIITYLLCLKRFIYVPVVIKLGILRFVEAYVFYFLYVVFGLSFPLAVIIDLILFQVLYLVLTNFIDREELGYEFFLTIAFIPGQVSSVLIFIFLYENILQNYFKGQLIYNFSTFLSAYVVVGIFFGVLYILSNNKLKQKDGIYRTIFNFFSLIIMKLFFVERIKQKILERKEYFESKNVSYTYLFPTEYEMKDIFYSVLVLSLMFCLTGYFYLFDIEEHIFMFFFKIFFLIFLLYLSILIIMKLLSFLNSLECKLEVYLFDQYGFSSWEKLSSEQNEIGKSIRSFLKDPSKFKGIKIYLIYLFSYIVSFGTLILGSLYKFKFNLIEWKYIGNKNYFEKTIANNHYLDVSEGRKFRVYFYLVIFLCASSMIFSSIFSGENKNIYFLIIFYLIFFIFIPLPKNIGFQLIRGYGLKPYFLIVSLLLSSFLYHFVNSSIFIFYIITILIAVSIYFKATRKII